MTMRYSNVDWDPTPSYAEFVRGVVEVHQLAYQQGPAPLHSYWTFMKDNSVGPVGVFFVLTVALGLTLLRRSLTKNVLQPVARLYQLNSSSETKMCESMWRFITYTFTFCWAFYSAVLVRPLFQKPSIMFINFESGAPVPMDIALLYGFEAGFYLHALYSLFFMDIWRKDSSIMAFHHLIALALLTFSYILNCSTSGLLILLFHDCCDVPLELSKIIKYLAVQKGTAVPFMEQVASVFFVLFTVTWFAFRLYFYPLRMIHFCSKSITSTRLNQMNFMYPSYLMALFLLVMNVYWTALIIRLIWNVATGRMTNLDDLRDTDVVTDVRDANKRRKTE